MILLIDNYDSFVYNLYQLVASLGAEVKVVRNDQITLKEIAKLQPEGIILSPGPGRPEDAGICVELIKHYAKQIPIFGVCLGHQAIAHAFAGRVICADKLMHGKSSYVFHSNQHLLAGLPQPIQAARYHSLCVERASLPDELLITAETQDGVIMGIKHQHYPCYGVQFHPESIISEQGKQLVNNFLQVCQRNTALCEQVC